MFVFQIEKTIKKLKEKRKQKEQRVKKDLWTCQGCRRNYSNTPQSRWQHKKNCFDFLLLNAVTVNIFIKTKQHLLKWMRRRLGDSFNFVNSKCFHQLSEIKEKETEFKFHGMCLKTYIQKKDRSFVLICFS